MQKYINLLKNNKQLLIPVVALLAVFLYQVVGDFFAISKKKTEGAGTIVLDKQFVTEEQKTKAALTVSKESELQAKNLAEEEYDAKSKANKNNTSYMRKQILDGNEIADPFKVKSLDNPKDDKIPAECKKDLVTDIIICKDKDGKEYFLIDGKKVYLNEDICSKSPYNATNECIRFMAELNSKKKLDEEKKATTTVAGANGKGDGKTYSGFGLDPKSKEYQKSLMLLSVVQDEYKDGEGKAKGFAGSSSKSILDRNKVDSTNNSTTIAKTEFVVKPGSSYTAKLINPLNSLYQDDVRPIMNIIGGDLDGYRLVGETAFSEASNGLIIKATEMTSPSGEKIQVDAVAIRYEGEELTPLFADEIDRHLGGRIGYSILGALSNDYSSMSTRNNNKDTTSVRAGDTTAEKGGEVMTSTFEELAQQYVTEVKVNPQNLIVIFY